MIVRTIRPYTYLGTVQGMCRSCRQIVPARIVEHEGSVYQERLCPACGESRAIIAESIEWYSRMMRMRVVCQPYAEKGGAVREGCPRDCGPCESHANACHLPVFSVTNACNMACPICFSYNRQDRVYHMTRDEIARILDNLIARNGPVDVVDITGGEPTLHPNIAELLEECRRPEIGRVVMNSNGLRLATDEALCEQLARLDVCVSLSFHTLKPERSQSIHGRDVVETKLRALESLQKHGIRATLLYVMIRGFNDDEAGDIVALAKSHAVVRSITVQTMTYTGQGGGSFAPSPLYSAEKAGFTPSPLYSGEGVGVRGLAGEAEPLVCPEPPHPNPLPRSTGGEGEEARTEGEGEEARTEGEGEEARTEGVKEEVRTEREREEARPQELFFTRPQGASVARHMPLDAAAAAFERATSGEIRAADFFPHPRAHPLCYSIAYYLRGQRLRSFTDLLDTQTLRTMFHGYLLRPDEHAEQEFRAALDRLWAVGDDADLLKGVRALIERLYPPGRALTAFERQRKAEEEILTIYLHSHMDEDTLDLGRLAACPDQVPDADGRLIPACAYNVFYRMNDSRFYAVNEPRRHEDTKKK